LSLLAEIEAICFILSESVPTTLIVLPSQLLYCLVDTTFQIHWICSCSNVFQSFFTIVCKTVAVVVPSPAKSLVLRLLLPFERPYFLMVFQFNFFGYSNAIFVTVGGPKDFPMITLRPFGPRVTLTAFANASTPRFNPSRLYQILYLLPF
jgi:hypothetical protein